MTPEEKQKIIEQAQQIADNGCKQIKDCSKCGLQKIGFGCLYDYDNSKTVALVFLAGIAFEKGEFSEYKEPLPVPKTEHGPDCYCVQCVNLRRHVNKSQ